MFKKYQSKKDFPGSEIGDVWVKAGDGFMSPEGKDNIKMHKHLFKPFNDWFEDYKEPKEYWYIEPDGSILQNFKPDFINHLLDGLKNVGNYFETKEEAEKAVEKLKAWKRLKDKGFRFYRWNKGSLLNGTPNNIEFACDDTEIWEWKDIKDDLDLLFGGEE